MTPGQSYESICDQIDQLEIEPLRLIIHEVKKRIRKHRIDTRKQARAEWEELASSEERELTIRLSGLVRVHFKDFNNLHRISNDPVYHLDDVDDLTVKFKPLLEEEAALLNRDTAQILIDPRTKKNKETILLHELIHFYMGDPDEHCGFAAYPSVAQGFSVGLYHRISPIIERNLSDVVEQVIARSGLHPISPSTHSVLFLLKSLDLDHQTGKPPGTVFGYYPEIFTGLSFK
ncbi:MAG: hypothetical protein V2B18_11820 [Pseudomonadota bacterium]